MISMIGFAIAVVVATGGVAVAGSGAPEWPQSGPMPDDPVKVRPHRYQPVTSGLKSYRPVEPMPWGDANRRVAPPPPVAPALPTPPATKQ